ncbi:MAG: hypothetical protein SFW09_05405 [Hyphomicrobiaceae bacterium]|nr:hypothetical protein [Hyphomicrobiaceae bacterium]
MQAHEALKSIFSVIVAKAERDPAFATEMIRAIGSIPTVEVVKSAKKEKLNPTEVNPVKILRDEGEIALRSTLDRHEKASVKAIAQANGIQLASNLRGTKATKSALVEAVLAGARFKLTERNAAR